jgi:hypothetical protein
MSVTENIITWHFFARIHWPARDGHVGGRLLKCWIYSIPYYFVSQKAQFSLAHFSNTVVSDFQSVVFIVHPGITVQNSPFFA